MRTDTGELLGQSVQQTALCSCQAVLGCLNPCVSLGALLRGHLTQVCSGWDEPAGIQPVGTATGNSQILV